MTSTKTKTKNSHKDITYSDGARHTLILDKLTDMLAMTNEIYHDMDNDMVRVTTDGEYLPIDSVRTLHGAIAAAEIQLYLKMKSKDKAVCLPRELASAYLSPLYARHRKFNQIRFYSRNPIFDANYNQIAPGFDPDSGFFYAGEPIEPKDGMETIDGILEEFDFKTDVDRVNFIGMLLVAVLINKFRHLKPLVLFCGNQAGIGKTTLASILGVVKCGGDTAPVTQVYQTDDRELEKELGTTLKTGQSIIILDNVKSKIDSPVLERCVTDPTNTFRKLGTQDQIKVDNYSMYCITANGPSVADDLIGRSIVVNLEVFGDPKKRRFKTDNLLQDVIGKRDAILAELLGMIARWKQAGMPEANIDSRDGAWAKIIGGILETSGLHGLNSNWIEASDELSEERGVLVDFLTDVVKAWSDDEDDEKRLLDWTTSADLLDSMCKSDPISQYLGDGTSEARKKRLTTLLKKFKDEKFELNLHGATRPYVLRMNADKKSIRFKLDDPHALVVLFHGYLKSDSAKTKWLSTLDLEYDALINDDVGVSISQLGEVLDRCQGETYSLAIGPDDAEEQSYTIQQSTSGEYRLEVVGESIVAT